jgi:hypothetical protein
MSGTAGHGWRTNEPLHVRSGSGRRFAAGRGDFVSSWPVAGGGLDVRGACGDWVSCSPRIRPYSSTFSRCSGRC